jgi:demethylmenaquinone methyltransferase/2-methoxy-6-polyprenyl-1,4-benzoquinol methylase
MPDSFYAPGEARAQRVNDLFATIAPRYDLINDLQSFGLHRYWKRRLIQLAQVRPGQRALDLCCGTGDVAFALADAGAQVTAADFSQPMLQVARQRSSSRRNRWQEILTFPLFLQADALHLPFPATAFDIVTISYGLRNLADFRAGLVEMLRVLKPGGRLLILDFGKPDFGPWRAAYFTYLRFFVPLFGKIFCGNSATHAYILESLKKYPAQKGIAALLQELNCRDIQIQNLLGGVMSINTARKRISSRKMAENAVLPQEGGHAR